MTEFDDWTALSARIRGLVDASLLAAELFAPNNDALGGMVHLGKHALAILNDLDKFGATLDDSSQHARLAMFKKKLAAHNMVAVNGALWDSAVGANLAFESISRHGSSLRLVVVGRGIPTPPQKARRAAKKGTALPSATPTDTTTTERPNADQSLGLAGRPGKPLEPLLLLDLVGGDQTGELLALRIDVRLAIEQRRSNSTRPPQSLSTAYCLRPGAASWRSRCHGWNSALARPRNRR